MNGIRLDWRVKGKCFFIVMMLFFLWTIIWHDFLISQRESALK